MDDTLQHPEEADLSATPFPTLFTLVTPVQRDLN